MNLTQLQALVLDIQTKSIAIQEAATNLKNFIDARQMEMTSVIAGAINPDVYVSLQTPTYQALLVALETASDQLGADAFH